MDLYEGNGEPEHRPVDSRVSVYIVQRLAFADAFQVNALFERLAHSLISGDLSKTSAVQVRVSTHPLEDPENGAPNRHNLAVEIPDVYNAEQAKEVRKPRGMSAVP